jgi:hydrogenase/urease accessory protein HupE
VSVLPMVQLFLQKKEPPWLPFVPVSGQYALLSRALRGEALPWQELALSYVVPLALAALALWALGRVLARESALAERA